MKLSNKILTFINHCLPEIKYRFSHKTMRSALEQSYKIPCSLNTLRKEFSNLKKQGYITHKRRYRKKIPCLTRKGRIYATAHLPYKKYGYWDGNWRLCILSIPEKERKYRLLLQNKLKDLGFQKMRMGVYISPYPLLGSINRIAGELGIRQHLLLLMSDKVEKEQITAQKIWDLSTINKEYKDFIKQAQRVKKNNFWPLKAKLLEQKFYELYKKDPHLPQELLPKWWQGERAYQKYKEVVHSY